MVFISSVWLFPLASSSSSSLLEEAASCRAVPVFQVSGLLRSSPSWETLHSWESPTSSLPWQCLPSGTAPSAKRAGERLSPHLRSMSLHGFGGGGAAPSACVRHVQFSLFHPECPRHCSLGTLFKRWLLGGDVHVLFDRNVLVIAVEEATCLNVLCRCCQSGLHTQQTGRHSFQAATKGEVRPCAGVKGRGQSWA